MPQKKSIKIVGIMSGTSIDGIDFVLCNYNIASGRIEYKDMKSVSFSKDLQMSLHQAANNQVDLWAGAELHFKLGRFYAKKLKSISQAKKWKLDLVGLHGQTVYHHGTRSTLQLGESSFIAREFKVPVVSNFRSRDIASLGEGAPLAPIFHKALLRDQVKAKPMAFHNLGGISNLTWIDKKASKIQLASFDTGPANMLLDMCYREHFPKKSGFDRNGSFAAKGLVDVKLLNKMLKHSYFKKPYPKSCGREEFGEVFYTKFKKDLSRLSIEDQLATLTELSAVTIAESYKNNFKRLPEKIYFRVEV